MISDAAVRQPRVEVLELVPRRLVPVGVEPQQRQRARAPSRGGSPRPGPATKWSRSSGSPVSSSVSRTRVLVERLGAEQLVPRPLVACAWAAFQVSSAGGSSARHVVLGRLGHALERVVQVDVALGTQLLKREDHRQHRAAAPDAALGERARQPAALAVAHSVDQRLQPRRQVIVYGEARSTIARSSGLVVSVGSARVAARPRR